MGLLDDDPKITYASNSILQPVVPSTCRLRQLQYGEIIIVRGYVPVKSQTFAINLQMGLSSGKSDTILHINPRMQQKVIVRNTMIGEKWGQEERHNGLGALRPDQHFECCILVHPDFFKIAFNKRHFADYRHRTSPGSINQIHVTGSVEIASICCQQPPIEQKISSLKNIPSLPESNDKALQNKRSSQTQLLSEKPYGYKLEIPFLHTIPQGLHPGDVIYISGKPSRISTSFVINLKVGGSVGVRDLAFHLSVRLSEQVIVCNTFERGRWGKEERVDKCANFPFQRGVAFDLVILVEMGKFKVSVNNQHLLEFEGFLDIIDNDMARIRGLEINGELKLVHIRMA